MTQNAVVKEIISPGVVQVSLMREMQCGSGCKACSGCVSQPPQEILALASDTIGTQPGEWVELESTAGNSICISMMVYLLPCLTMLAGYLLGTSLGLGEGMALFPAILGIWVGFIPAKCLNRKIIHKNAPEFSISCRKELQDI